MNHAMSRRVTPTGLSRREALKRVWTLDAPAGQSWRCPTCGSRATLGGNAGYHAHSLDHEVPKLEPLPTTGSLKEATAEAIGALGHAATDRDIAIRVAQVAIDAAEQAGADREEMMQLRRLIADLNKTKTTKTKTPEKTK